MLPAGLLLRESVKLYTDIQPQPDTGKCLVSLRGQKGQSCLAHIYVVGLLSYGSCPRLCP